MHSNKQQQMNNKQSLLAVDSIMTHNTYVHISQLSSILNIVIAENRNGNRDGRKKNGNGNEVLDWEWE